MPLSENQRKQAGTQYHDASIREVERDGHELRQREDVDDAHPACLTGLLQQFASQVHSQAGIMTFFCIINIKYLIQLFIHAIRVLMKHNLSR